MYRSFDISRHALWRSDCPMLSPGPGDTRSVCGVYVSRPVCVERFDACGNGGFVERGRVVDFEQSVRLQEGCLEIKMV
jgi:hypothetical protein